MELWGIPLSGIRDVGGWFMVVVVLGLGARMLFTGTLVTRREADALREDRDSWRKVAEVYGDRLGVQSEQLAAIVSSQQSIERVVTAIPVPREARPRGGR